ncbi:gastrula zinc finger protein XlCGF7.1-like [Haliotis rubra]|uniref:gastrula zinc finger protein XlCGF7.1-like n=1 Tax=Haliotis rubra TaxID=36100 RepID=UPI001EE57123|nr:gastrula zinc finger protein XlCGF7.1-like [Haliotis rubra]
MSFGTSSASTSGSQSHQSVAQDRAFCKPLLQRLWFFEAHKLKFHLETHKRQEDRQLPYRCVICLRQYHNRQSWNDHMNTHTGAKPYKCNVCPSTFAHRIGLHRHKLTHEKECPFKCPYCSRGFKVKANLNAHITMHTGISKHTCNACGKVFTVATSLRRHKCQPIGSKQESSEKETEEPYTYMCGVCNMTFQTLELAETHSLTHVDGATGDMSLVGVQVEEVTDNSDFATSGSVDASTTYIVHNNGQSVTASDISAIISSVEEYQSRR